MADPFLAEIRIFPFSFAPKGWAFCDGQLLPLSQNTALFSLLGTSYGGDGKSNFALPDLQGSAALATGEGPGMTERFLGEQGGAESVTLLDTEIPMHSHTFNTSVRAADTLDPGTLAPGTGNNMYASAAGATMKTAAPQAMAAGGGSQPHNNMQPYLTLNFCIAMQGIYPPRT
jgi:microcystin-dependent protein